MKGYRYSSFHQSANTWLNFYKKEEEEETQKLEVRVKKRFLIRVNSCQEFGDHCNDFYGYSKRARKEKLTNTSLNFEFLYLNTFLCDKDKRQEHPLVLQVRQVINELRSMERVSRNLCRVHLEKIIELESCLRNRKIKEEIQPGIRKNIFKILKQTKYTIANVLYSNLKMNLIMNSICDFFSKRGNFRYKKDILSRFQNNTIQKIFDFKEKEEFFLNVRMDFLGQNLYDSNPGQINHELRQTLLNFQKDNIDRWKSNIKKKMISTKTVCKICAQKIPISFLVVHSKFCVQSYDIRQNIKACDQDIIKKIQSLEGDLRKIKLEMANPKSKKVAQSANSSSNSLKRTSTREVSPYESPVHSRENDGKVDKNNERKSSFSRPSTIMRQQLNFEMRISQVQNSKGLERKSMKELIRARFRDNYFMVSHHPHPNFQSLLEKFKRRERDGEDGYRPSKLSRFCPYVYHPKIPDPNISIDLDKYSISSLSSTDNSIDTDLRLKQELPQDPKLKIRKSDQLDTMAGSLLRIDEFEPFKRTSTLGSRNKAISRPKSPNKIQDYRKGIFHKRKCVSYQQMDIIGSPTFKRNVMEAEEYEKKKLQKKEKKFLETSIAALEQALKGEINDANQVKLEINIKNILAFKKQLGVSKSEVVSHITHLLSRKLGLIKKYLEVKKSIEKEKNQEINFNQKLKSKARRSKSLDYNQKSEKDNEGKLFRTELKKLRRINQIIKKVMAKMVMNSGKPLYRLMQLDHSMPDIIQKHVGKKVAKMLKEKKLKLKNKSNLVFDVLKILSKEKPEDQLGNFSKATSGMMSQLPSVTGFCQSPRKSSRRGTVRKKKVVKKEVKALKKRMKEKILKMAVLKFKKFKQKRQKNEILISEASSVSSSFEEFSLEEQTFWSDDGERRQMEKFNLEKTDKLNEMKSYEFVKLISKGAYGVVWLVKRKLTGDYYAMKITDYAEKFEKNQTELVEKEIKIFKELIGDFVVKAIASFPYKTSLCAVMEYMPGGDLGALLEREIRLYHDEAQFYIAEILLALEGLHIQGIIHRDLKPDNILLDKNGHAKLADFGLSERAILKKIGDEKKIKKSKMVAEARRTINPRHYSKKDFLTFVTKSEKLTKFEKASTKVLYTTIQNTKDNPLFKKHNQEEGVEKPAKPERVRIVGTPQYMAPEMTLGEGLDNPAVDYWALGVILFEMLIGCTPFDGDTHQEIFKNIRANKVPWDLVQIGYDEDEIWPEAKDLIQGLMTVDPKERLGSNGVDKIKQHPFFKGFSFNGIKEKMPPFPPELRNMEDVDNFFKERVVWKKDDVVAPTEKKYDIEGDNTQKAINEMNKKENDINFMRKDILHKENEITSKKMMKRVTDEVNKNRKFSILNEELINNAKAGSPGKSRFGKSRFGKN